MEKQVLLLRCLQHRFLEFMNKWQKNIFPEKLWWSTWQSVTAHFWVATHSWGNAALHHASHRRRLWGKPRHVPPNNWVMSMISVINTFCPPTFWLPPQCFWQIYASVPASTDFKSCYSPSATMFPNHSGLILIMMRNNGMINFTM